MLTTANCAILLWPLLIFTPFVVSVPMSHVLSIHDGEELFREKRAATTSELVKNESDISPKISSFTVTTNIKYRYATTTVSNRVSNPADVAKEIYFTVTLPDSAFISKFLMIIKDKVYEAYVKEKEDAKKEYQEAVDRGDTAGHVELSARDSNLFTVSVNVEPQSKVTFNLTYEQLLTRTLGLYENIVNLNPGQVIKSMYIEVNIEESSNITSLQVPDLKTSNEIDSTDTKNKFATVEQSGNKAKVNWSPNAQQQQEISQSGVKGQFIVRYDVDRVSNPNQILVDEGYFVHFFAPEGLKTLPKHVLFALDISGSMSGRKIEQLRESLTLILSDIGQGDYFSLILFSDSVQLWTLDGTVGEASSSWNYYDEIRTTPQPEIEISQRFIVPATSENIAKAKAFAATLNETGGTNIIAALRKSLQIAQWGQKQNIKEAKPLIIFLTDGQPNVEMSDTEEIVKTVKKLNVDQYPVFSLAFGEAAELIFLRKLSLSNSGFARNIYLASDTHLQLKNFYKQVASPILANVSFDYIPGQVNENTLTKSVFNNLFNGSELVVAGKLADGAKTLNGNLTGQKTEGFFCIQIDHPYIISDKFPPLEPVNRTKGHLEKLWAYLYIKELLDKDLISDEKNSTYKQKALKLSLEYSFVTPLTSLVVVKPNETSKAQPVITDNQNVEESLLLASPISLRGPSGSSFNSGTAYYQSLPGPAAKRKFAMNRISTNSGLPGFGYMAQSMNKGSNYPQPLSFLPLSTPLVLNDPLLIDPTTLSQPQSSQITGLFEEDNVDFSSNVYATELPAIENVENLLNISDILWLKNVTDVKFPSSNNTYSIGQSDLPNTEFQSCLLPNSNNTLGHCRHLAHCVLPAIINSFESFVPYGEQCVIDARFVGICCPQQYAVTKSNSTTTEAITSTSLTSGPTTLIPTISTV